jgi:hypothetical protein
MTKYRVLYQTTNKPFWGIWHEYESQGDAHRDAELLTHLGIVTAVSVAELSDFTSNGCARSAVTTYRYAAL